MEVARIIITGLYSIIPSSYDDHSIKFIKLYNGELYKVIDKSDTENTIIIEVIEELRVHKVLCSYSHVILSPLVQVSNSIESVKSGFVLRTSSPYIKPNDFFIGLSNFMITASNIKNYINDENLPDYYAALPGRR